MVVLKYGDTDRAAAGCWRLTARQPNDDTIRWGGYAVTADDGLSYGSWPKLSRREGRCGQ